MHHSVVRIQNGSHGIDLQRASKQLLVADEKEKTLIGSLWGSFTDVSEANKSEEPSPCRRTLFVAPAVGLKNVAPG
jgi:hypothetical protein